MSISVDTFNSYKLDSYAEEEIKPTYKIKNIQECFYSFGQIKFKYKFSIISSIEYEDDGFIKMTIMTFNEANFTSYEDGTIFYCLPRIKRAVMDTKFVFRFKADSSFDFLPQRGADYPQPDREGGVCRAGL